MSSTLTKPNIANGIKTRAELLELWREAMTGSNSDHPSEVVLAELCEYFGVSRDEALDRCVNWEDYSVAEWKAADRTTPEGLREFYETQTSWIYDTMWYHAEQYFERKPAESVNIVEGLMQLDPDFKPGHHLDFGGGPGTSSLFFLKLGWQAYYADISTSFMNFAKWRFRKHNASALFYNPATDRFPREIFDLVTAFDVMVHVPDIEDTLKKIHDSMRVGGYFVFNIDNLPRTERTEYHLYEDQYPILGKVRGAGFKRLPKISYFHVYQKIQRTPAQTQLVRLFDKLRYNAFVTAIGNIIRKFK